MTTLTLALPATAQEENRISIEQTIHQFAKATADRDVHSMYYLLHENFQGMVGQSPLTKSDYMKMLGDRKLGGQKTEVAILNLEVTVTIATAKIRLVVQGETIESYCHLQKGSSGWQVLYMLPYHIRKT